MFPGFVSSYKDTDGYMVLFFFPGIDEDESNIYKHLDLSKCNVRYTEKKNDDGSIEYTLKSRNIAKVTCKLLDKHGKVTQIELSN